MVHLDLAPFTNYVCDFEEATIICTSVSTPVRQGLKPPAFKKQQYKFFEREDTSAHPPYQ